MRNKLFLIIAMLFLAENVFSSQYIICPKKIRCYGTTNSCTIISNDDEGYFIPTPKPAGSLPVNETYTYVVAIEDSQSWIATCSYIKDVDGRSETEVLYHSTIKLIGVRDFVQKRFEPPTRFFCRAEQACLFERVTNA